MKYFTHSKNDSEYEKELLRYIEGLSVSKEFLEALEDDPILQKKVTELKSDIYFMEHINDSDMLNLIDKKASIEIENGNAGFISAFMRITPLPSRGEDDNLSIYTYRNIELIIRNKTYKINISNIKMWCIIEKDGKKIVNIMSKKDGYDMEISKGQYIVKVDGLEAKLTVK